MHKKTCPQAGFLLLPIHLLQQGNIRYLQEQIAQLGQQRQSVYAHVLIFCVHHHVLKELIHRLAQGRQLNQRILVTPLGEVRLQLIAQHD